MQAALNQPTQDRLRGQVAVKGEAGDVWLDEGLCEEAEMEGLALCEACVRPGACMMLPLARRGAIVGVEADCGKPYCC